MPSFSRRWISKWFIAVSVYLLVQGQCRSVLRRSDGRARGNGNDETGSLFQFALHVYCSAVCFDNPGDKTQTEPEAFFRIGGWDAVEAVEDVRQMIRSDAHACIFHDELHLLPLANELCFHRTALPCILDRIRQQIRYQALHLNP